MERYTLFEVKESIKYFKRNTGCKNVNAFIKDVTNAFKDLGRHEMFYFSEGEIEALKDICKKYNIDVSSKEVFRNVFELTQNVISETIFLSEDFILKHSKHYFDKDTNFHELLTKIKGFKNFEFTIYDVKSAKPIPLRVSIVNTHLSNYIEIMFDLVCDGEFRHYPTLFVERDNKLCYFKHYDKNEAYRDSFTLKNRNVQTKYFRCNFNSVCKKSIENLEDFVNSHYCDCNVFRLLPCLAAYCEIEKAKNVKTRYKVEEKIVKDIRGKVKTANEIGFKKVSVEAEVIDKTVSLESMLVSKIREKREYKGGHHASPIPHDRRGYWRRKPHSLERIWIEPTRVKSPKYTGPSHVVLKAIQV